MAEDVSGEKKALDLGGEMPAVAGVETDEELLLARDVMSAFVKAIKAFRFYPADNPTLKGFQDTLLKKFQFFLNKFHLFALQIGEYEFSFKGRTLYENRDPKTSLAFSLYKDGLRELRFVNGLEEWEVRGLVDIIKRSGDINQLEDDLVTLMWEKDFLHIGYLATDEFLEEDTVSVPENVEVFRKNLVFRPPAHHVEVDLLEEDAEDGADLHEILSRMMKESPSLPLNKSVYFLTPDEVEGLRKDVDSEADPTFVFNITDILFEILVLEKEPEPYEDAVSHLNKVLAALITLGEFEKASDLLKRVQIILKTHELKDWQIESLGKIIFDAGEPDQIERIGRVLEKEENIPPEKVGGYLVLLQRNSIKPLIHLLGALKNSKTRRVICDALSEMGKNAIELITPFIDDRRWYLVRNVIYILGRIGKEQSLPYLQKAFNHQEVRVRREVVQGLGLIGGPKAVAMLVRALLDADVRIRAMAAINLGKIGKSAGLGPLLDVVQSKDFPKRDPAEMRAFFEAIGMIGSKESVPVLQKLLERKSWFIRGKRDEIRMGAANTLAMVGTPEAKAILEAGKESKDETLRDACIQALRIRPSKEPLV